jgi:hypothetical protein
MLTTTTTPKSDERLIAPARVEAMFESLRSVSVQRVLRAPSASRSLPQNASMCIRFQIGDRSAAGGAPGSAVRTEASSGAFALPDFGP